MKTTIIAALAFGLFAAASANAVSWDCTKARSYSEKLICANPDFSEMDDHLAATYQKAKKATGNSAAFKKFQNENWKRREACQSPSCVRDWYRKSEDYYSEIIRRAGGSAPSARAAVPAAPARSSAPVNKKTSGDPDVSIVKPSNSPCFVRGLKRCLVFPFKDHGLYGNDYVDGRRLPVIVIYMEGHELMTVQDENGRTLPFSVAERGGPGIYDIPGTVVDYAIGQYDFDGDGADEVVVARRMRLGKTNGIRFAVYRVHDPKSWAFIATDITDPPVAEIRANKIRVSTGKAGATHVWTYRGNDFHESLQ